jgi:cold shock CspA family protein
MVEKNPLKGVFLWFNPQKGFGMIRPSDLDEDDVLCPALSMQGIVDDYLEGTVVNYYAEQQLIGMVATSVWMADQNL